MNEVHSSSAALQPSAVLGTPMSQHHSKGLFSPYQRAANNSAPPPEPLTVTGIHANTLFTPSSPGASPSRAHHHHSPPMAFSKHGCAPREASCLIRWWGCHDLHWRHARVRQQQQQYSCSFRPIPTDWVCKGVISVDHGHCFNGWRSDERRRRRRSHDSDGDDEE